MNYPDSYDKDDVRQIRLDDITSEIADLLSEAHELDGRGEVLDNLGLEEK